MTPKEILIAAKAHLQKVGWYQGGLYEAGPSYSDRQAASRCCAFGALCSVADMADATLAACRLLEDVVPLTPGIGIGEWNDAPERTFDEVLEAFDKAIALA